MAKRTAAPATWHVVVNSENTVLAVFGGALLADATELADRLRAQSSTAVRVETKIAQSRPRVGDVA